MSLLVRVGFPEVCVNALGVFLLKILVQRVLVPEDEVQFEVLSTLIRSKHDAVRRPVVKLLLQVHGRRSQSLNPQPLGVITLKPNRLTRSKLGESDSNLMYAPPQSMPS